MRAAMLAAARKFFAARTVLEVETPVLCAHGVTDPHITNIGVTLGKTLHWLRTSPEYHMKRLLAAGADAIYQFSRVFRNGEHGARHNPEFTMLEVYQAYGNYETMMDLTERVIVDAIGSRSACSA